MNNNQRRRLYEFPKRKSPIPVKQDTFLNQLGHSQSRANSLGLVAAAPTATAISSTTAVTSTVSAAVPSSTIASTVSSAMVVARTVSSTITTAVMMMAAAMMITSAVASAMMAVASMMRCVSGAVVTSRASVSCYDSCVVCAGSNVWVDIGCWRWVRSTVTAAATTFATFLLLETNFLLFRLMCLFLRPRYLFLGTRYFDFRMRCILLGLRFLFLAEAGAEETHDDCFELDDCVLCGFLDGAGNSSEKAGERTSRRAYEDLVWKLKSCNASGASLIYTVLSTAP